MHPRITVIVTTTLLSASLGTGCKKDPHETEPPHVNEGPQPEPDATTDAPAEEEVPEADFSAGDAEMGENTPE